MKIGEAAKETGLSISNIRFYEKKGLLEPAREEESRYRNYTEEDILRLKKIIVFRKMNLPIETIDAMLKGHADAKEVLKKQEEELLDKVKELEGALELCRALEAEQAPLDMKPEEYLNYIAEEEQKGKRFSKAEEFLDSMLESAEALSGGPQSVGFWTAVLGNYARMGKYVNLGIWLIFLGVVVFGLITGEPSLRTYLFWGGLLLFLFIRVISYWKDQVS